MSEFQYITNKIQDSKFIEKPFPHLEINNFLSNEHFNIIINDNQVHFDEQYNNGSLYKTLLNNKYKIQPFPGCLPDWNNYIKYLNKKYKSPNPIESVGITFRLTSYRNDFIKRLLDFMNSNEFHKAIKEKFKVKDKTRIISAIQKNLTGYEISPHPDIRQKCLTYLLNINKNNSIENYDCHTHLLEFKDEYKHIEDFWENNTSINRCWVPWNWCNTIKKINKNNTFIIFKPASSPPTMHAIKLNYDHLKFQRTQIYGNLMYSNPGSYEFTIFDNLPIRNKKK